MYSAVATRYARALADVVAPTGKPVDGAALEQLRRIQEAVGDSAELRQALLSPAVPTSKKRAIMEKLLWPVVSNPQVRNFLFVVINHRRVSELPHIVDAFEELLDERMGYVRADVTTAKEIAGGDQSRLVDEISSLSGKKAKVRFSTNPALVAGAVARIGSTVYDGSVRGQLDKIRVALNKG
ncbi:MAG: ATP synthase F1 subunit delta [Bryobacterales bacterium]|nr:ATP synthase F1 subunit delta [Bryobacterales bacterium]MBV9400369.1 ATP synthase F1 subunit delta [Bryobacterales bacterium]